MEIQNKKFVHIHELGVYDNMWFIGSNFVIDKNFYPQRIRILKSCYDMVSGNNSEKIIDYVVDVLEERINSVDPNSTDESELNYYKNNKLYLDVVMAYRMELALEKARKKIDKHLPSRIHSIWLTDEKDAPYWREKLSENSIEYIISASGNIFRSSASLFPNYHQPFDKIVEEASAYWLPEHDEEEHHEYLFQGNVQVIRKY